MNPFIEKPSKCFIIINLLILLLPHWGSSEVQFGVVSQEVVTPET